MSFSISHENQQFIEQTVGLGVFRDLSHAVNEAVAKLRESERERLEFRLSLQEAIDQLKRGEYVKYGEGDEERFLSDIKELSRQMSEKREPD